MENFSKSILNYFATYNETRFRFNRKIPYRWTNDEFTQDFSVFPDFERELLDKIKQGEPFSIDIRSDDYKITLDLESFKSRLMNLVNDELDEDYLQSCFQKAKEELSEEKVVAVDEDGEAEEQEDSDFKAKVWNEAYRTYNLTFRRQVKKILNDLQARKINRLKEEFNFEHRPLSSFNQTAIEQTIFDDLQNLRTKAKVGDKYLSTVRSYIKDNEFDLVMYNLYLMLTSFVEYENSGSTFLFFHEICEEEKSGYPLYFLEVDVKRTAEKVTISNTRDILMLNTPAVNSFKFDNILTTQRATLLEKGTAHIKSIDRFLQNYYKHEDYKLLTTGFKKLVAEDLPNIKPRIGLQILDEDRKVLDYSELITQLDEGAGEKFVDLVTDYIEENVESTREEVDKMYKKEYPNRSVKNIVSEVPIKLNDSQKRVLLASKNQKNKMIKVEGPPGTGKSHTITALVYLANRLNKSVLISSHKKQALDVVEEKLTEEFKELHPKSKPSVLRLTKKSNSGDTPNDIRSTLSSSAIGSASKRTLDFNESAVQKDKEDILSSLKKETEEYWYAADEYPQYLKKSNELLSHQDKLFSKQLDLKKLPAEISFNDLAKEREILSVFKKAPPISLNHFKNLSNRNDISELLQKCDDFNQLSIEEYLENKVSDIDRDKLNQLQNLVDDLVEDCNVNIPLKEFLFDDITADDLPKADLPSTLTYSEAVKLQNLLEKLEKESQRLLAKFRDTSQTKELKNTLKLNFPQISAMINELGVTQLMKKVSNTLEKVNHLHDDFPFLDKDYLLFPGGGHNLSLLSELLDSLESLEYADLLKYVANYQQKEPAELTLADIKEACQAIEASANYYALKDEVTEIAKLLEIEDDDLQKFYTRLSSAQKTLETISGNFLMDVFQIGKFYTDALSELGVSIDDVSSFHKLAGESEQMDTFWNFVLLHEDVCKYKLSSPPEQKKVEKFHQKEKKLLEYKNDERMKNLNNHAGDIQRAITAVESGKRLTDEQSQVLFDNLSCIIAPPELISEYFPMSKDIVDMLIIDEASQVSIAQSISLILRSKQTIVFGDELQYGAVSARNVSKRYSERYFKNILDDYEKDKGEAIDAETKDRLASEVSEDVPEDERQSSQAYTIEPGKKEWLKTFSIRTSTLSFAEAIANYKSSLDTHFRSFPEIISYSKEKFYEENEINLITNRIRTKPINETLQFLKVETQGNSGKNVNLDEITAIQSELEKLVESDFSGTLGIICSFKEQKERMQAILAEDFGSYHKLKEENKLAIWFVGDVQGVERDRIYYSFVEDKKLDNGSLKYIYPAVGGTADNIHNLKKQRLNVGFSRAKDTMVFVHSMEIGEYADSSLGEALRHYEDILKNTEDNYVEDETIFDSPQEERLYSLLKQTDFYQEHKDSIRLIPQFEIGRYIKDEYHDHIPDYRADFLLTLSDAGKETSLIIEYDGLEYHFKDPENTNKYNFDNEYTEYHTNRRLELESYGYSFLSINKFNLMPEGKDQTEVDVLNGLLLQALD